MALYIKVSFLAGEVIVVSVSADNAVAPLDSVMDIQTYLSCNGFSPGPIDGVAGGRTTAAIKTFQASVGLTADGIVGPATKQAMRSYSAVTAQLQYSYSSVTAP